MVAADANITIKQMAENLSLSTRAVEKQIAKLREKNLLSRDGADNGGSWVILSNDKKDVWLFFFILQSKITLDFQKLFAVFGKLRISLVNTPNKIHLPEQFIQIIFRQLLPIILQKAIQIIHLLPQSSA